MQIPEKWQNDYLFSAEKWRIDILLVHGFLSQESYWAKGIPMQTLQQAVEHSLCFGIYNKALQQVGFARLVTDYATFGYLADVFVLPEHRGQGLSKMLMAYILDIPLLHNFRRVLLATHDAHGLYAQFGFVPLENPERFMQIRFVRQYA